MQSLPIRRWLLCLLLLLCARDAFAAFSHPGLMNNAAELTFMASQINTSQQPWLNNWNDLNNHLPTFDTGAARNVSTVDCNVNNGDTPSCNAWRDDGRAAYLNALHWKVTGTTAYATKTIQLLNHAATTVNAFTSGSGSRLRASWHIGLYLYAAEIMQHVYGGWAAGEQTTFRTWLTTEIKPLLQVTDISGAAGNPGRSNWATYGARARMAMGVFLDDQALFDRGFTDMKTLIRFYIGQHGHSSVGTGFTFETCRQGNAGFGSLSGGDLVHTQMALIGMLEGAEIAKKQGLDLFGYLDPADNAGIRTALLYHDQWIGFSQRSGSTSSGWPCTAALSSINTSAMPAWRIAANHYGEASFGTIADWCDTVDHTAGTFSCGHWQPGHEENFAGVTHRYNSGGGATPDTTAPTQPTINLVSTTHNTINLSATGSNDAVGVTNYRWMRTAGACGNPTSANIVGETQANTFSDTGLAANTTYCYRVDAEDAANNDSMDSATLQVTTGAAPAPPPVVSGAFYVATNGSNNNTGTIGSPFATVQHACGVVQPGGTIYIRAGTYQFSPGTIGCASGTSWNAPVTIRSYPGENVTWQRLKDPNKPGAFPSFNTGSSASGASWDNPRYIKLLGEDRQDTASRTDRRWLWNEFCLSGHASHIHVENIELTGCSGNGIEGGNFWTLINLSVHGSGSGSLSHGLYAQLSHALIKGGHWFDNPSYGLHIYFNTTNHACVQGKVKQFTGNQASDGCGVVGNTIDGVEMWHTRPDGDGGSGLILRPGVNNLVMNSIFGPHRAGVALTMSGTGNKFFNNTFYGNLVRIAGSSQVFRNNIFWRPGGGLQLDFQSTGHTFDHNLESTVASPSPPILENASAGNYRLKAGSPAINAGASMAGIVTQDKDGATRPVGGAWDIGAYEFGGTVTPPSGDTTPPSIPTNVTLTLVSTTQVDLNWDDSTGTPAGYRVYRCDVAQCQPASQLASPTASAYSDTTVVAATTYTYAVSAVDSVPNESAQSAPASITTAAPPPDITAPSVPTDLACAAAAFDQINCTFTASTDNSGGAGVAGYRIRRCQGAACSPTVQVDTSTQPNFSSSGLSASTTYGFAVAAVDAASPPNVSAYTATVYATTPAAPVGPTMILLMNNNTTDTGSLASTPTPNSITFTTTAAALAEGTHAAVFNATTDYISVPLTAQSPAFSPPALIDDCNRTENPLSNGGQWSSRMDPDHTNRFSANGTRCLTEASGTDFSSWWNAASYGPDMRMSVDVVDATSTTATNRSALWIRVAQPSSSADTVDGYVCQFEPTGNQVLLRRAANGSLTTVKTCTNVSIVDGDQAGCEMIGSALAAYVFNSGAWTNVCSILDGTYTSAGLAGMSSNTANFAFDNIRIGNVPAPTNGFVGPTNTTIRASFYADTAFVAGTRRYIYGDTTAPTAGQRRYIYTDGARLAVGLGDNAAVTADVLGADLAINTLYRVALRIHSNGTYDVVLMRDGTGVMKTAAGTYSGLTALNPAGAIGNRTPGGNEAWLGSIDTFMIDNRILSDAELNTDCQTYVASCTALLTAPTFDAFNMVSGVQGDGVNAANNSRITVTLAGSLGPDPAACQTLSDFLLFYDQVQQAVLTCSISGTVLQLTAASPPASANIPLSLTHTPSGDQILLTNSTVGDVTTGQNLAQHQWWCRRPGPVSLTRWAGEPNSTCHVPSPPSPTVTLGALDVQMDLVWTGSGTSPAQNYALYCDATVDDEVNQGVRVGAAFDQHGPLPIRFKSQGTNQLLLADGAAVTPELPDLAGITAVAGGTMRRQEAAVSVPVLNPNERTEYRFALEFNAGIPSGTIFGCELRPAQTGVRLTTVIPARIEVGPSRFIVQ